MTFFQFLLRTVRKRKMRESKACGIIKAEAIAGEILNGFP
jgi:hypothetical protein